MTTDVDISGPLFDGRAQLAVHDLIDEIGYVVGAQAYADVMTNLNTSIRHPTPYYETQIALQQHGNDVVVHDRGVIYGPWLEGTSSRNKTTRFKGYASFRRAAQALEAKVPALVAHSVAQCVGRMN